MRSGKDIDEQPSVIDESGAAGADNRDNSSPNKIGVDQLEEEN